MAIQKHGWVTLEECINLYIDRSEQSNHKYFKLWNIGCSGCEQLGINFFYQVQTVKLPINSNFTVNLPDNYIKWAKVGVGNSHSEIIPLDYNNKLNLFADLQTNRIAQTEDNSLFNFYFGNSGIFYNYWNGDTFETLYGLPSGGPFVGSFKIDNSNGLIVLNDFFQYPYVFLEMIAAPKEGATIRLPIQFKEAMVAFLGWQDNYWKGSTSHMQRGDKESFRHNFYNERRLARAAYKPFEQEEAYEWNLKNQRATVKA